LQLFLVAGFRILYTQIPEIGRFSLVERAAVP